MRGATHAQGARFGAALAALGCDGRIGLAVSGGPDSLALLLLAHVMRPGAIEAATVDHGLRAEAAAEARMVADACRRLGVAHTILTASVVDQGEGRQAAARAARYAALEQWAGDRALPAVATAHHADDQAETILMRLARGAGVAGLAGVRPARTLASGVRLLRPLLSWRRDELSAIVAAARLTPADDPSNRDPRYDRTRVRALLAQGWPEAPRLAAAARHLAEAEEALDWATGRECGRLVVAAGEATLDPMGLPDEILRRLVVRALRAIDPAAAFAGPDLSRLIERLRAGQHATLGTVKASPGLPWKFAPAPPHRT